jgi:hypothetical protein
MDILLSYLGICHTPTLRLRHFSLLKKKGDYPRLRFRILIHYNNRGLFCDPNIIVNNKERCFRNPAIANHNSSQTLMLLQYHNICTRTIASPLQLPNLIQSQNFSDYNCFYPLFAINITSKTICSKPIIATT